MDFNQLISDLWDVIACIYSNERTDAIGIIHEILEKIELEK